MATKNQELVSQLYVAILGRAPEQKGFAYWVNSLEFGRSIYEMAGEVYAAYADNNTSVQLMTNEQIVRSFYKNALGRDTDKQDSEGINYWTGKLNEAKAKSTGTLEFFKKAGTVLYDIVWSTMNDYQGKPDAEAAHALLVNKAAAGIAYAMAGGSDTTNKVLDSVTGTMTLAEAEAVGTSGGQATSNAGQTFTLTTGINNVVGTSGNDTVNAAFDSSAGAPTFSSLDSIDGGAGTDTMNVVSTNLAGAAGSSVKNVEIVNLSAGAAITAADVSGWTGLQTINVASGAAISGLKAAATTDVNVLNGLAGVTVNGGKNVVVNNSTAGNIVVGNTTAAAGNVTAKNDFATGTVGVKGKGALTATANDGAITFTEGTSITAAALKAVSAATVAAHLASQAAADDAATAAAGDTDASGQAKLAAAAKVTALGTLKTAIAAATKVSADQAATNSIGAATTAALNAGAITLADKVAIDAAFGASLSTSTAAARTAAQAVLTPLQTAAAAAKATADTADMVNDANAVAAKAAADAVVIADNADLDLVDGVNVTATTNTALASASVKGNVGATNTITDGSTLANVLTTVTLENAGDSTLNGLALTNVSAKDMSADVEIQNATAGHAATITLEAVTGGTYTDVAATTVNIVANGANQNVLTALSASSATKIDISGAAGVNLGALTADAAAVIDASASTGKNTVALAAGQKYTGGSGVDIVTTGGASTVSVDGGAGTADRLNLTGYDSTKAGKYANFEVLSLDNSGLSVDASKFTGSSIGSAVLNGGTTALTGLSAAQAAHLTVTASGTYTIGLTGATTVGQLDTVSIDVNDGLAAQNQITLTTPVLTGVETLNLAATDDVVVSALTSATALTNVNVTGAGDVVITSGSLALNVNSVVDASGVSGDVVLDFSIATANGISLKGGDGDNFITGTNIAGKGNLISSGNGDNTLIGGQGDDVIAAGNGANSVTTGSGANKVTLGNGNNSVTGGSGVDTITVGNGINVINAGGGNDVISVGTGYNLVTGGAGGDKITFGAHVAGVIDGLVYGAAGETFASAVTSGTTVLTGADVITGLHAGDTIDIAALGTFTAGNTAFVTSIMTAGTAGDIALVRGNFDATSGIFTASSTGADTLVQWDSNGVTAAGNVESVVLVGTVSTAAHAVAGVITL